MPQQAKAPAVAPPQPPPSTYPPTLTSQSSTSLILLSLALLLSSGVLIKTFHPKYRFRAVTPVGGAASSKANKRRESVLKSIILAQEAVADSAAAAGASGAAADRGAGGGRSRSTSSVSRDDGRGRSASSVASTSAAIIQGLSKLSTGAGPHLSSPASRQEPIASGSRSPSAVGTPSRDSSTPGVSFASAFKVEGSGKKGKSKKGKGVASVASLAPPTAGTATSSPTGSPRRRPMKDASTSAHLPLLSFIDAAIQTDVPYLSLLDTSSAPPYPPSFVPLPSSPPPTPPPTTSTANADVQTSPSLLPQSLPRLLPYDLHASFQSTPSPAHTPPIAPPLSRSPSHDPLLTPAPRSRKQARKASATALGAPTNTVVGMPRPPKSKEVEEEQGSAWESMLPTSPSPARKSGVSLSRSVDSPESGNLALPLTNGGRQGIGLASNGSPQKGKGRELSGVGGFAQTGMANGTGLGRYGIPAPIPIPVGLQGQRRMSTQSSSTAATTASSYSNPSTSSSSPYLAHPGLPPLPPMSPPGASRRALGSGSAQGRGSAKVGKDEEEVYWRSRNGEPRWDSGSRVVGLGVEIDGPHDAERGRIDAGRSWSEAAGGSAAGSRGTSPCAPATVELPPTSIEGAMRGLLVSPGSFFPAQLPGLTMSPVAAPMPLPIAALSATQATPEQPWTPQLVAAGYTMNPSSQATPSSAHPPPAVNSSSGTSSQSRPSSRQSSLSVPLSTQQQQQQQQHQQQQQQLLQQHQAYAYAQAQAQYQHTVALHYQAQQQQQHHQQQQQQHQREQSDQLTAGRDNGYPSQNLQTPQLVMHGWTSHPSSPGLPPPPNQYSITQSPTSATFPPPLYAYYASSSTPNSYLPGYHLPQTNHQGGNGRQSSGGKMRDTRKSPRLGVEKQRSFSGPSSPVPDLGAWKARMRTAEMDADRAGKELEIARWRLAVLEEERIAGEVENQEALAALATRAMRAEARLKALEEARHQDSSSTSGSGSPVTRPSSVMESTELPSDPLPPSITCDEPESRFLSSPTIKVHPLAWLDLTTISLTTQSQSQSQSTSTSSSYLSSPGGGNRKGRGGRFSTGGNEKEGRRRHNANGRRRSTNSVAPTDFELEDEDDEEVLIVLDSPMRRKLPPRPASRRSSYLGDDDALNPENSIGNVDDEELSTNGDFDDGENGERGEPVDYIGSLPTFLKTTHNVPLVGVESPRFEGDVEASHELVVVPSFVLDCGTPSPNDENTPHLRPGWSGDEREEERVLSNGLVAEEELTPTPATSSLISMCV